MYVAGVMVDESRMGVIEGLGFRDSKTLTPQRREYLSKLIEKHAEGIYVLKVTPRQIDELRKIMTMNQIMVITYAKVLENLKPDKAILDAADVKEERFAENVRQKYGREIELISEHKADAKYALVSAASITAKVNRDRSMRRLERDMGVKLGSGYPSDSFTREHLKALLGTGSSLPNYVRRSWNTIETVSEEMHR